MINLPKIGFGTFGIGGYNKKDTDREKLYLDILETALIEGIVFFDTAENYASGYSETLLGKAVCDVRDDIIIATKISPENLLSSLLIEKSINDSLGRLNTDYIDIYQVHWPHPKSDIKVLVDVLQKAIKEEKIRYVGVCNYSSTQVYEFDKYFGDCFISVQNEYNLIDNTSLYNNINNKHYIAYSPLKHFKDISKRFYNYLDHICNTYDISFPQLILSWLMYQNIIPIFTSLNKDHIKNNLHVFNSNFPTISPQDLIDITSACQTNVKCLRIDEIVIDNNETLKFNPSPEELRLFIEKGISLKPIKVKKIEGKNKFILVEGLSRYLAYREMITVPSIILGA